MADELPQTAEEPQELRGIDGSDISTPRALPAGGQTGAPGDDPDYLKFRQGEETPDQTYRRLWQENRDRGAKEYHSRKALEGKVEHLTGIVTPLLQRQYRELYAQEIQRQEAAIPDRETDPDGYRTWLAERQYQIVAGQAQQTEAERVESVRLQNLIEVDAPIDQEVIEIANGADPEAAQNLQLLMRGGLESARQDYPDATDDELAELVTGAMRLQARTWRSQGITIAQGMQQRIGLLRSMVGAGPAPNLPRAGGPSPTAQRLTRQSNQARRTAALAPAAPGSPGGRIQGEVDWGSAGEAAYMKAALEGQFDPLEYAARRFGKHNDMYEE